MGWRKDLSEIQRFFTFEPMDAHSLQEIDKMFREMRPGPWKMRWNRRAANYSYSQLRSKNEFIVHLIFENEHDEMWWLLKNGD